MGSVDMYDVLRQTLTPDQVLCCGSLEYEKAVFIGNLNYRFTSPAAVVMVESVQDVRATIDFARQNGVRLTVKNGGHSYMGYCLNQGGIVLDMSRMRGCYIDSEAMTIEMEGGLLWKDVYYKHLKDKRNIVIGGQCPTVGVSGFTLGAGLSPFSRSYGLGCDNVLAMTVITYDGKVVEATPDHKDKDVRDLFWAMQGGGGGNFGVVVNIKSKMHKLRDDNGKVVCGQLLWNLPQQKKAFEKAMDLLNTTRLEKELTIDALWSHSKNKQLTGGMTVIYNGNMQQASKALSGFLGFGPSKISLEEMNWTDWVHQSEGWDPKANVYHHHASFIFAEGAITPELNAKISELVAEAAEIVGITDEKEADEEKPNKPKCHFLWDHIGAETERVRPEDTAFPWRSGHYVANIKMQWTDADKRDGVMNFIDKARSILMPYTIEQKAAYINYIDGFVPNWQEAYYGCNYPRLQEVKTRWDPYNFFYNWQSIEPLRSTTKGGSSSPHPKRVIANFHAVDKHVTKQPADAQQVRHWWNEYAPLCSPARIQQAGEEVTAAAVFEKDAEIRGDIIRKLGVVLA